MLCRFCTHATRPHAAAAGAAGGSHLQCRPMPAPSPIDQIAERVERLLVRHEEMQRTNALLTQQVDALTRERDALKARLAAARTRIDAMLERLPAEDGGAPDLHPDDTP